MKTVVVSLLTAILLVSSGVAYAQNGEDIPDAEGCTDHPFVTRMKGYIISMCYELTAPGPILIDKGGLKTTEIGTRKTDHNYFYLANIEYEEQPTHKEVLEHYKRTFLKTAQLVYMITENSLHGNPVAIFKQAKNNQVYWIIISFGYSDEPGNMNDKNSSHSIRIIALN